MFITPHKEHTRNHKYKDHTNENINLNNVVSFCVDRQRYYPDNEGIPTIVFTFIGNSKHSWFFDVGEEELITSIIKALQSKRDYV